MDRSHLMTAMNDIRGWWRAGVLGVSALTGAVWWMNFGSPEEGGAHGAAGRMPGPLPGEVGREFWVGDGDAGRAKDDSAPVADDHARRPAPLPGRRGGDPGRLAEASPMSEAEVWSHYEPTREELAYRAQVIEQQAERELQRLLQVLDLTEERQDRVFAALVRSSEWYHPSLQAAGSGGRLIPPARGTNTGTEAGAERVAATPLPGQVAGAGQGAAPATADGSAAVSPLVLAELTPEEAGVYERYTSERTAFWAGVVEDAERQLQSMP